MLFTVAKIPVKTKDADHAFKRLTKINAVKLI